MYILSSSIGEAIPLDTDNMKEAIRLSTIFLLDCIKEILEDTFTEEFSTYSITIDPNTGEFGERKVVISLNKQYANYTIRKVPEKFVHHFRSK